MPRKKKEDNAIESVTETKATEGSVDTPKKKPSTRKSKKAPSVDVEDETEVIDVVVEEENVENDDLKTWIDTKCSFIEEKLHKLIEETEDKKVFLHPILLNLLRYKNPSLEKAKDRDFTNADDLEYCLHKFQDLVAEINMCTVFVPSIESFSAFMGWSANTMKVIANQSSEDIQAVMSLIDDYIIDCQLTAGQTGVARANVTMFRTQVAGEHGQSLMTAKEEQQGKRINQQIKTKEQMLADLNNLGINVKMAEKQIAYAEKKRKAR